MMGFGMIGGMILFWGLLILLAVLLIKGLFHSNQTVGNNQASTTPSPREILEQRYARGEITQEQFLQMEKDLQ
ncbi:SHOCT domain-containing protein [Anaerolinea sp.]|uniref:SHOCT domain-containing protein n=1 Tax=Anaerolinea sp. TaxID=1872519 RepID=UPI002ACD79CC|nr:SHOCT domain-containing protein [Anaerolinea sp.]